jgi:uncharacterized protein YlxP (DUF503 family)
VIIGVMMVQLHLPVSGSLKDKRQVVKSLQARLQNQFGIAVAEVGELQQWQIAELGIVCVANETRHVDQVLDSAIRFIEETRPDLEIMNLVRETASYFS